MLSIGHRSGLLDAMRRINRSATAHEIADESGLNERYVREWLDALVTGRVIDYDPVTRGYHLPPEHAGWLTREATPNNLAGVMQFMSLFGKVEDHVLDCFHNGGGVPYERFDRFHEVMAEESFQTVVSALDEHILPLVDGLIESMQRGVEVVDVEKNLDHPVAPFLYTISTMHCMTVSLAHCGCGLGTCWGEELALKMLQEAGFTRVTVQTLDHDIMNNYYVCRKS